MLNALERPGNPNTIPAHFPNTNEFAQLGLDRLLVSDALTDPISVPEGDDGLYILRSVADTHGLPQYTPAWHNSTQEFYYPGLPPERATEPDEAPWGNYNYYADARPTLDAQHSVVQTWDDFPLEQSAPSRAVATAAMDPRHIVKPQPLHQETVILPVFAPPVAPALPETSSRANITLWNHSEVPVTHEPFVPSPARARGYASGAAAAEATSTPATETHQVNAIPDAINETGYTLKELLPKPVRKGAEIKRHRAESRLKKLSRRLGAVGLLALASFPAVDRLVDHLSGN